MKLSHRLLWLAAVLALDIGTSAVVHSAPAYPVKIGPTGRYLVDRHGKPFLLLGESPQAMMVNVTEADAERFFANRETHGFNTVWINLLCATYTGGREDGSTLDGLKPFDTPNDLSTPNEAYFAHCDRVLRLAAKHGMLVLLDPAETGSYLAVMQRNGVAKCRNYGRYLGKRYARFDNLLWFHGNDYGDHTAANDALVLAIALGIKEFDRRHLHTLELNPDDEDARWDPILGLRPAYTYGPTYVPILKEYNRQPPSPVFLEETGYEFEHLQPADTGTPHQLRVQEYQAALSGSTGQLYGNGYTWPFKRGWQEKLDTPGALQFHWVATLLEPRPWWKLVPDRDHTLVTGGYGEFGSYGYVTAARTPDGALAMAYLPEGRPITVDMAKLKGPVVARWYDPSVGRFESIAGSPLPNRGSREFVPPGHNADGPGNDDWVLVLETRRLSR